MSSIARTVLAGIAATVVAVTVSACNSAPSGWSGVGSSAAGGSTTAKASSASSSAGKSSGGAATTSPDDSGGGAATTSADSGGSGGGGGTGTVDLPSDFPMPPGADPVIAGQGALVTVTDPKAAYDFWIGALPGAGYTLGEKASYGSGAGFAGTIDFSGKGIAKGTIAILGTTVAISTDG